MATTSPITQRPVVGRSIRANRPMAELVEDAIRRGEGMLAADGPLVVRTGKHTGRSPRGQVHRRRALERATTIWWGAVNRPISEANYDRLRARLVGLLRGQGPVQPGLPDRGGPRASASAAGLHGDGLGQRLRAEPVPSTRATPSRIGVRAELHDHLRAVVQGGSRDRGHPDRDRHPPAPPADGDPHRRDRIRGRDQEERLHRHELPHARRGRPADAQRGQRR